MGEAVFTSGQGLLSDVVILTLEAQPDRAIEDQAEGLVTRRLKFLAQIPESATSILNNTLGILEKEGVISREIKGRRTYKIQLNTSAIPEYDAERRIAHLDEIQAEMRERFPLLEAEKIDRVSELPFFKPLLADCHKVLAALQEKAAQCTPSQRVGRDQYKINGKEVLKEAGFTWSRAKVVVHYLAALGLADIQRSVTTKTWVWKITDKQIPDNPVGLKRVIRRENGMLYSPPSSANYRPEKDTKKERKFARGTPSVLPDSLCGPLEVANVIEAKEIEVAEEAEVIEIKPASLPEPTQVDNDKPTVSAEDAETPSPIRRLLAIIKRLEKKIEELEANNEAKDEEIRQLKLDKQQLEAALLTTMENSRQDAADAEAVLRKYPN